MQRTLWLARVVLAAALMLAPAAAAAASIGFQGSTLGCFGVGCSAFGSPVSPGFGITYTGASFDTAAALDGTASLDFGAVSRDDTPFRSTDGPLAFRLQVTFVLPTGLDGGSSSVFVTTFSGTNTGTGSQLVIDFLDNTWHTFTYSDGLGTGSFELMIADPPAVMRGNRGSPTPSVGIVGSIRNATYALTEVHEEPAPIPVPVPEPLTVALVASGFAGVALRASNRRRRSNG